MKMTLLGSTILNGEVRKWEKYTFDIEMEICKFTLTIDQFILKTYSETICTESSLHFSVGSENSFKTGFKISSKATWSTEGESLGFLENTSFPIFSRALFLVPRLSSARQLISL